MDKLELDGHVSRLERRFVVILAALVAAVGVCLIWLGRSDRAVALPMPVAVASPPPTPTVFAPDPFMGDMGMMGGAGGSMPGLYHELSTLTQLLGERMITEPEWQAKKAQVLARELIPGDLRSDLKMVQELADAGALTEEERAAFVPDSWGSRGPRASRNPDRSRLLGAEPRVSAFWAAGGGDFVPPLPPRFPPRPAGTPWQSFDPLG